MLLNVSFCSLITLNALWLIVFAHCKLLNILYIAGTMCLNVRLPRACKSLQVI